MLGLFGIQPIKWLFDPTWAKPAFILMSLWLVGFQMVIFLAGLQGVLPKVGALVVGEPTSNAPLIGHKGALWLRGLLAARDGKDVLRGEAEADVADGEGAERLGLELADDFHSRGAARFIAT